MPNCFYEMPSRSRASRKRFPTTETLRTKAAVEVVVRQQEKHPVRVFTYDGNPVKQVSTRAWYKALNRAGSRAFAGTVCAVVRTPHSGSSGRPCREGRTQNGHKSVTATFSLKTDVTISHRKTRRNRDKGRNRTTDTRISNPLLHPGTSRLLSNHLAVLPNVNGSSMHAGYLASCAS
jgi:hypothetical protein